MPYGYLDNNSVWGDTSQRIGDSFSNAVVGIARLRQQQALQAQQQAMDRAYLQLAVQKLNQEKEGQQAEIGLKGAEAGYRKAQTTDLQSQGQAGGIMGDAMKGLYQTDPNKNPDVTQLLQSIIAQQQTRLAATYPQNIGKQIPEIIASRDPRVMQMIATGAPSVGNIPAGGVAYDYVSRQPLMANPRQFAPQQQRLTPQQEMIQALAGHLIGAANKGGDFGTDTSQIANQAFMSAFPGGTNAAPFAAPAVPTVQTNVNPQRQIGQTVTTDKGTFRWVGNGWEPVEGGGDATK